MPPVQFDKHIALSCHTHNSPPHSTNRGDVGVNGVYMFWSDGKWNGQHYLHIRQQNVDKVNNELNRKTFHVQTRQLVVTVCWMTAMLDAWTCALLMFGWMIGWERAGACRYDDRIWYSIWWNAMWHFIREIDWRNAWHSFVHKINFRFRNKGWMHRVDARFLVWRCMRGTKAAKVVNYIHGLCSDPTTECA